MSLIERLRNRAKFITCEIPETMMCRAADEIERLEGIIEGDLESFKMAGELYEAKKRIAKLDETMRRINSQFLCSLDRIAQLESIMSYVMEGRTVTARMMISDYNKVKPLIRR